MTRRYEPRAVGTEAPISQLPPIQFPLLEASPDAVAVVGVDGGIVATNANLLILSGYTENDLVGAPIEMLVPGSVRARHVAQRTAFVAAGAPDRSVTARRDLVLRRADATEVPVEIALRAVAYQGDQFCVATVRDATSRRTAEFERRPRS